MSGRLLWVSGFAACGAIKVAFEGDPVRCAMLIVASVACIWLAASIRARTEEKGHG